MAVNLIRNSRVFFTTNVDSNGKVRIGSLKNGAFPMTTSNCWEIQVLEGLTFSQNTTQDTVTLNEAGAAPSRGQRSFNTALQPLDFSFSTYIRPYNTGSIITAEERVLWNAFGSANPIGSATAAWSESAGSATLSFTNSNKHRLQTFGLIIIFDNTAYALDNCALDTATIDFGIDAIGTIAWAGKGAGIRSLTGLTVDTASPVNFSGADVTSGGTTESGLITFNSALTSGQTFTVAGLTYTSGSAGTSATDLAIAFSNLSAGVTTGGGTLTGTYTGTLTAYNSGNVDGTNSVRFASTTNNAGVSPDIAITGTGASVASIAVTQGGATEPGDQATAKQTYAQYITNKLSTMVLNTTINNFVNSGGTAYTIALTGGQIVFNNNLTYLTPANLAQVNLPITYFTGTRAITGNVTAYLKTGTNEAAQLLADMYASSTTTVDPKFTINVQMGGPTSNATGVEFKLPAAMLQIPQINTAQVISTTINFTAQGYTGTSYDITQQNEASLVYRAGV